MSSHDSLRRAKRMTWICLGTTALGLAASLASGDGLAGAFPLVLFPLACLLGSVGWYLVLWRHNSTDANPADVPTAKRWFSNPPVTTRSDKIAQVVIVCWLLIGATGPVFVERPPGLVAMIPIDLGVLAFYFASQDWWDRVLRGRRDLRIPVTAVISTLMIGTVLLGYVSAAVAAHGT